MYLLIFLLDNLTELSTRFINQLKMSADGGCPVKIAKKRSHSYLQLGIS